MEKSDDEYYKRLKDLYAGKFQKPVRKAEQLIQCKLCTEQVLGWPALHLHKEEAHGIQRRKAEKCPVDFCNYVSFYGKSDVAKHIKRMHPRYMPYSRPSTHREVPPLASERTVIQELSIHRMMHPPTGKEIVGKGPNTHREVSPQPSRVKDHSKGPNTHREVSPRPLRVRDRSEGPNTRRKVSPRLTLGSTCDEGSSAHREASPPTDLRICGDMSPVVLSEVDCRTSTQYKRVLSSPNGGYSSSDSDTESMCDAVSPAPPKSMPDIALPRQPLRIASACIKCESEKDIQKIVDAGFQITELLFKNEDDCVLRKPVNL